VLSLFVFLVLIGTSLFPNHPLRATRSTAPNIVLILTDDQRWDTLWAMPHIQSDLVAPGMTFSNAFVVNPLCCPSRTSILTGKYSHTTGVYDDGGAYGGFPVFRDRRTLATWLRDAGYHTGLIGKYLNGYLTRKYWYIPPGWDRWFAILVGSRLNNEAAYYYDYDISDQGVQASFGHTDADYSTDVFAAQADTFIRTTSPDQPLFLYLAPAAPHEPATPPTRYADAFSDLPPSRPPNFNEDDVSDKPAYIQAIHPLTQSQIDIVDAFRIDQYRTLLAVDDLVHTVVTALSDTGRLGNTMIVFASDNGLTWAEHRRKGKLVPYEESIRIPLVIRYDPGVTTPGIDDHLVTNLDFASTFTEISGAKGANLEGTSLVPLLSGTPVTWRNSFLVEHYKGKGPIPTYCEVRSEDFAYVDYGTGEEELYDLEADPYQLDNRASDPALQDELMAQRIKVEELCEPPPPEFVFDFDVLAPTVPTDLAAAAPGPNEVDLSWTASTDNVAVTGYTVYRDGVSVATVDGATTSFVDTGVLPNTTYTYTVDAFDAAENHSAASAPVTVTTPG
jgi:N-acetylglucosamine-6-sulfatase